MMDGMVALVPHPSSGVALAKRSHTSWDAGYVALQAETSIPSLLSRRSAGREGWELLRQVLWGLNQSVGIP